MSETLWAVIIGGAIASVTAFITSWFASRTETNKWRRERKLEHLQLKKSELKSLLAKVSATVIDYEASIEAGDPPIRFTPEFADMLYSSPHLSIKLWTVVAESITKDKETRLETYREWMASIGNDLIANDLEIEKLLK